MNIQKHPEEKIHDSVLQIMGQIDGASLVSCKRKEEVLFDEKDITYDYIIGTEQSDVRIKMNISDPLSFCYISLFKNDKTYFPFESYLKNKLESADIEDLYDAFIDNKIEADIYTLKYLNVFKKYLVTSEVKDILAGNSWPDVPVE